MFQIRLKELREKAGYSQQSFADAIGVKQSTVGNWEAGAREPKLEVMQKLADFFDVSVDYLIGRDNTPRPRKEAAQKKEISDEDIKFALFGGDVTDEAYEDVKRFAQFIKEKYEKGGKDQGFK